MGLPMYRESDQNKQKLEVFSEDIPHMLFCDVTMDKVLFNSFQ